MKQFYEDTANFVLLKMLSRKTNTEFIVCAFNVQWRAKLLYIKRRIWDLLYWQTVLFPQEAYLKHNLSGMKTFLCKCLTTKQFCSFQKHFADIFVIELHNIRWCSYHLQWLLFGFPSSDTCGIKTSSVEYKAVELTFLSETEEKSQKRFSAANVILLRIIII